MNKDNIPLKYARTMLKAAEAQGYDAREVADSLHLPFDLLDEKLDGEAPVAADVYSRVFTRVMWLLQDESFGLHMRTKAPAGTFRMMCLCIIHSPNLEHAIRRAAEFNTFCRNLSGIKTQYFNPLRSLPDKTAEFRFPDEFVDGEGTDELITLAHCTAIWRRFFSWLIGKNIELLEVSFKTPEPHRQHYLQQLLKCPLQFGAASNSFRFAAGYLAAPLIHTEDSLREFLRNAPYHLLASNQEDDKSVLTQMKRIIGNDFTREFPSVVEMAEQLNMSVRTLRRRLKDHGTTYQNFKDTIRRDAATLYLSRPELKINAVSALLGFDEPSAFHRSFKKWTGMTPGDYRARQVGMDRHGNSD